MLTDASVVYRSNIGIRELIIDWVLANPNIPTEPNRNWSLRLP